MDDEESKVIAGFGATKIYRRANGSHWHSLDEQCEAPTVQGALVDLVLALRTLRDYEPEINIDSIEVQGLQFGRAEGKATFADGTAVWISQLSAIADYALRIIAKSVPFGMKSHDEVRADCVLASYRFVDATVPTLWRISYDVAGDLPTFTGSVGDAHVVCRPSLSHADCYDISVDGVFVATAEKHRRMTEITEYVAKAWLLGLAPPKGMQWGR